MRTATCWLSLAPLVLAVASGSAASAGTDLTELSLEQLMDVPITGASKYEQKQSEVAAAVSVITREDIKTFGWRTIDEALASLPGIYTTYDRQYSYLGTRGFSLPGDFTTRVLLTVNGNRWNDAVYDAAPLGRQLPIDLDLIERIEFIPGPGGAVYGQNALFGVVNLVTRSGMGVDGAELAVAGYSREKAGEGRATWGKRLQNGVDVLVSATGYKAKGQDLAFDYGAAGVSGVAAGMDGGKDGEFFASLAGGPWSFDLAYGNLRKDDPTGAYFSDPLVRGQYQQDRNVQTQLQYRENLAQDTLQLTGRLFLGQERYTGSFSYGTPFLSTGASDWWGGEVRLLFNAWQRHKLMLGLEYQDNTRQDQTNQDLVNPANSVFILGSSWRAGAYVQDEWRLSDRVSATLGLRFDRNSNSGNALSPRAALIWRATAETSVKGMYGRANRAPNAFERNYGDGVSQVANPALQPETIDTFELVLDHRVGQNLLLRGSAYRWTMRGLITLGIDPVSGLSQYQAGQDVDATGVELSADKTWSGGSRLHGSVSHQSTGYNSGASLPNSPEWLGKLNFSSPLGATGLRLGYELQYYSSRRTLNGSDLSGYWLSNLQLTADKWAKGLEVSLAVYNLFDQRYAQPAAAINWQNAFEQDGIGVRAKLLYRF